MFGPGTSPYEPLTFVLACRREPAEERAAVDAVPAASRTRRWWRSRSPTTTASWAGCWAWPTCTGCSSAPRSPSRGSIRRNCEPAPRRPSLRQAATARSVLLEDPGALLRHPAAEPASRGGLRGGPRGRWIGWCRGCARMTSRASATLLEPAARRRGGDRAPDRRDRVSCRPRGRGALRPPTGRIRDRGRPCRGRGARLTPSRAASRRSARSGCACAGRLRLHRRPLRLRQVDAAAAGGGAPPVLRGRAPDQRDGAGRRAAADRAGLRLPVTDPSAVADGGGERPPSPGAAGPCRARESAGARDRGGRPGGLGGVPARPTRTSSPAGCRCGSRWRGRWSPGRSFCCSTSRSGRWTTSRGSGSTRSF